MNFIDNGRVSLERGVFIGMWVGAREKKEIELLHDRMGSPEMAHHRAAGPRAFVRTWGRIWGETWGPRLVCLVSPHAACPHASQFGSCDYIQPLGSRAHLRCVKEGKKNKSSFCHFWVLSRTQPRMLPAQDEKPGPCLWTSEPASILYSHPKDKDHVYAGR